MGEEAVTAHSPLVAGIDIGSRSMIT